MSLSSSRNRLTAALKELMASWEQARALWDDPVSQEFGEQYLSPLEPRIRNTLTAMEKMEAILARARADCT